MIKRMLRGYLGLLILMGTPLALITVLGMVAGNGVDQFGIPMIDGISLTMILAFQLYGGFNTMEYIREDLTSSKKWRMYSLPYGVHKHALSIIFSAILFSALQGLAMILYTQWVYGVNWGNIVVVILVLLLMSTLTQLIFFNFVILMKNYKNADRLGTAYGIVSIALAGVWFPMPKAGIFNFLSVYGNPLSLGRNVIYAFISGDGIDVAIISIGILFGASVITGIISMFNGRRKLA